jgi:hypothetical protein
VNTLYKGDDDDDDNNNNNNGSNNSPNAEFPAGVTLSLLLNSVTVVTNTDLRASRLPALSRIFTHALVEISLSTNLTGSIIFPEKQSSHTPAPLCSRNHLFPAFFLDYLILENRADRRPRNFGS